MSGVNLTVDMDLASIEDAFSADSLKQAQTLLARRIGDDSNRYCKWDTGATWESMVPNSDFEAGEISWATPYAGEAYYNPNVGTHPTNPNGKTDPHPQWFEVAKGRHLPQWVQLAKELMNR